MNFGQQISIQIVMFYCSNPYKVVNNLNLLGVY